MVLAISGSATSSVSTRLVSVSEVDAQGAILSSNANTMHKASFDAGANAAFSLGAISADASLGVQAQVMTAASARTLITGSSTSVSQKVLVYSASGDVMPEGAGGLTVRVDNGTAEVETTITSWPWCTISSVDPLLSCLIGVNRESGAFLDLEFDVSTRAKAMMTANTSLMMAFDIGTGGEVIMSKRASVGGSYVFVADGYPMVKSSTASSLRVVVRIPRPSASASGTIKYDPIMRASGAGSASGSAIIAGDVSVGVASSGKVTMSSVSNARTAISAQLESVSEVDASGSAVTGATAEHKFTASVAAGGSIGIGPVRINSDLGVDASVRSLSATFLGQASIDQSVMVFTSSGTVMPEGSGGFSAKVRSGTVKMSSRVSNWPWCCGSASMDLRFTLDTRAEASQTASDAMSTTFSLGGGASAVFSNRVSVGGSWQAVASGYPKLDTAATTSSKAVVVVRVARPPNSNAEIFYDPTVESSDNGGASSSAQPAVAHAAAAVALAAVLASIVGREA